MTAQRKPESWYHSPEFDAKYRHERKLGLAAYKRRKFGREIRGRNPLEIVADPEDVSREAFRLQALQEYFARPKKQPSRRRDMGMALPDENDLDVLASTFGATPERLTQAVEMRHRGLGRKAKRLVLCGRIGHRVNCSGHDEHRFYEPYMCHTRYCVTCGPAWFRRKFSELLVALEPSVEHLLHESRKHGKEAVIAKIDFTIPNTYTMPSREVVQKFHSEMNDFWDVLCRLRPISRDEYGIGGVDEFGGNNTNLHRHCVYVGPLLPQRNKELSAIWSIVGLPAKRRRWMLRFVRACGLAHAWAWLKPEERRFVSIKRARSFRAALAHALKYPAKFLSSSTPERLAALETTFHHTRRFSTGGAFYNLKPEREPGEDSRNGACPICGARLHEIVEPWSSVFALEAEGRLNLEAVRRMVAQARVFSEGGSP